MAGALETLFSSPVGRAVARRAGLPEPTVLRRGRAWPAGPVALHAPGGAQVASAALRALGVTSVQPLRDEPQHRTTGEDGRERAPAYATPLGALVIDATEIREIGRLEELRTVLRPVMRGLERSGRVIVVARTATPRPDGVEAVAVASALDGLTRTVGKELRGGATANLVFIDEGAGAAEIASTLEFLLQGRSAFVSGQAWHVGRVKGAAGVRARAEHPFDGRVVVVTGAARGIGAEIARTFARGGAQVVAVDVPAAGDALARVANEIRGSTLQLDVTAADAGEQIARHVAMVAEDARVYALIHCAGITRDKLLANLDERRWAAVLDVNLAAQLRINERLLRQPGAPGALEEAGRIVSIASTSGIAGNKGQANYAASKAGVVGLVRAMRVELSDRGVTVNAVAPGFIETDMTAAIPFLQREVFRRINSLAQGGAPVDVAETIAYLAEPASAGVDGQMIRVCGQNLVGA